jgi:hypothetical protein
MFRTKCQMLAVYSQWISFMNFREFRKYLNLLDIVYGIVPILLLHLKSSYQVSGLFYELAWFDNLN